MPPSPLGVCIFKGRLLGAGSWPASTGVDSLDVILYNEGMEKNICGFLFVAIVIAYAWSLEFREEIKKWFRKFTRPWRSPAYQQEHKAWLEGLSEEEREQFSQALEDPLGEKEDRTLD